MTMFQPSIMRWSVETPKDQNVGICSIIIMGILFPYLGDVDMGGKLKPLIDESMKAMFLREQYPWRGRHILRHNWLAAQRTTSSFEIILPTDASYDVSCKLNNLIENLHELFWRENFLWRISTKLVFEWTSCSMHKQIGSGMWFWLKQSVVSLNYIMESVNNFVHLFSTNLRIIEQIDQNGFVENCLHILFWRKN